MNTSVILLFAIGVFALMAIGIVLTMLEFNKLLAEEAAKKGAGRAERAAPANRKANIRTLDSSGNAA